MVPRSQVEDVSARVRGLLSVLRPRLLVGAAASGADLVVLTEEALAGAHPPDHEKSARDRLEIFCMAGDRPHVIDAILGMFTAPDGQTR